MAFKKHIKIPVKFEVGKDRRVYLPTEQAYQKRFTQICNEINKPPSKTIKYFIDLYDAMNSGEDLRDKAPTIAEALQAFLLKLKEINIKHYVALKQELEKRGIYVES